MTCIHLITIYGDTRYCKRKKTTLDIEDCRGCKLKLIDKKEIEKFRRDKK